MTFKKRHILWSVIALELVSIPAAAQIIDRVAFSVPQKAIHVRVVSEPGVAKFVVSSNAPFAITAQSAIGEFKVNVHKSGLINGKRFGDNAQMPGAANNCGTLISPHKAKIYEADRKTAANKGEILSQAVIVEIRYDADITPDFKVLTETKAKRISTAAACESTLS